MTARLPPPSALDEAQADAVRAFEESRGRGPFGPFATLLHSPELMVRCEAMGEYLRYRTVLEPRLSELAILVVARHWNQPVEWAIHQPIALQAGVPKEVADAIGRGERPKALPPDETALYNFCRELCRTRTVGEPAYRAALAHFGERGVIDLAGICGYYALLAAVMNVAGTEAPGGPRLPDPIRSD